MAETPDLAEIHEFLVELAGKAGEMITSAHPLINGVGSKKNSSDLVTETDRAVEAAVSEALRTKYPHYEFMGEETYHPSRPLTDAPTFVVDPIDGTVNFVHGFPSACISLGFAVDRQPVRHPGPGRVHEPDQEAAAQGGRRRAAAGLSSALVAVEWGSDRSGPNWETKVRTFENLGKAGELGGAMVHSMRSMGSAALNLCAVASGVLDLYWEGGCWAWDVCAGWVILLEAGGIIVDGNPGGWQAKLDSRRYLAVRGSPAGEGQRELVQEFWSHVGGSLDY
ncbi:myo-inositol-1-monophosphotase [Microsporum canis CBS 113480]|uniref:Inositol-1-monophosphatase n=1 Tax=Arthroderma otae (strain ATCC MYA-4605 / CBS 113480) TaxID=554155 RepID=C5FGU3_ARTOC|nr:myo-inositol-1-monophosphotase [Microsporum canis CBS 113480]EEQ29978.1 myo-inositol-1-monophosphotase [Microsporum canis CBS 113480]